MDVIEDICFNALNDLDDIDTPTNTTTFTNYVTTNGSTVTDKYGTISTKMDPVPQIASRVGTTN